MNKSQYDLLLSKNQNQNQKLQNQVNSLTKRFKILIIVAILLFTLFLVFLLLYATKECDCVIIEQCSIKNQFIRLNNTNLQTFQMIFDKAQAQLLRHKSSNIVGLDLSQNYGLKNFDNNYLPDLEQLTLLDDLNLIEFVSNDFPILKALNIQARKLQYFKNNSLPLIKELNLSFNTYSILRQFQQNNLYSIQKLDVSYSQLTTLSNLHFPYLKILAFDNTQIENFENNSLPAVNNIGNGLSYVHPTTIKNNNLGLIQSLTFNKKKVEFKFMSNTLIELKVLTFSQCSLLNFTDIYTNNIPSIQQLFIVSSPIINFQPSSTFIHLKQLYIQNTTISEFKGHTYLDLQNLTIIEKDLATFQNNNFNVLKYWNCNGCNFLDLCTDNRFPRLQVFNLFNSTNQITNIDCLNNSNDLSTLTFYSSALSSINNFYLPNLKNFQIGSSLIKQFKGNIFPSLDSFYLVSSAQDTKFQINIYSVNLTKFEIHSKGSLQIKNQIFNKLTKLQILNMGSLSFKNNSLPVIKTLYLSGLIDGSDFDQNTRINPNIQGISIANSPKLTSFTYMSELPKIIRVSLYGNSLTRLNCTSFKNVQNLQLNGNKFKSDIVKTLIDCDFPNIKIIDLSNNKIQNIDQAKAQLKDKYNHAHLIFQ